MNKYSVLLILLAGAFLTSCEDTPEPVPLPPSNLTASVVSTTQIDLAWSDNSTNETGFKIERKDGLGEFTVVGSAGKDIHVYSDQGLTEKTAYTYRVFALNAAHETGEYSNEVSATTHGTPVLSTTAVSAITPFAATSGGNITDDGGSTVTARGIVWSINTNPTIALSTKTSDGAGAGSFVSSLTGLNWETEYHVRAYATYSTGTTYGDEVVFTTAQIDITTAAVIEITHKAATSGGTIGGDGGTSITARGVVWGTSSNPTVALSTKTQNGTGTGSFSSSITNLSPNITYYIRSYASNSAATSYGLESSFVTDHEITDIEGNIYPIVQIGTQIWMAENLKAAKFNDDTAIPEITNNIEWGNLTTPGYGWYNNDKLTYSDPYGALYNWYAANTAKLCPTGWHVPSDAEWTTLTSYLGGLSIAGGKLKETGTVHWDGPNTGATNESGFAAPGSGYRTIDGTSVLIRREGNFWTSTELDSDNGWYRFMGNDTGSVIRAAPDKNYGNAVRCLSD